MEEEYHGYSVPTLKRLRVTFGMGCLDYDDHETLPETNSSTLKIDGWKMNDPFILGSTGKIPQVRSCCSFFFSGVGNVYFPRIKSAPLGAPLGKPTENHPSWVVINRHGCGWKSPHFY